MSAVTITRIAAGGDGVGRLADGMAVFVPRTAPDDVAEIEIVERKRRYARARLVDLETPSGKRAEPRCRHYVVDGCGGCQLQHLSAESQLDAKRAIVGDALRRIGGHRIADPEIVPSPDNWRYRCKITLGARGGRLGLHRHDRPDEVFELDDCPITRERLMELWHCVRRHRDLLPSSLAGVVLREDRCGGLHVIVRSARAGPWDGKPLAKALGSGNITVWWQPQRGAARVVVGAASGFPALAFEQVNPELAHRIRKDAVAALAPVLGSVVWDLYGGAGDTAALLAARGAEVWTVDADRQVVEWAMKRGEEQGVTGVVHRIAGRVEDELNRLPEPGAVVVNPPRVGLAKRVAERLEYWASSATGLRVSYISCDPATLARDLRRMPALRVRAVIAYDLFPHTSHVETLVALEAA